MTNISRLPHRRTPNTRAIALVAALQILVACGSSDQAGLNSGPQEHPLDGSTPENDNLAASEADLTSVSDTVNKLLTGKPVAAFPLEFSTTLPGVAGAVPVTMGIPFRAGQFVANQVRFRVRVSDAVGSTAWYLPPVQPDVRVAAEWPAAEDPSGAGRLTLRWLHLHGFFDPAKKYVLDVFATTASVPSNAVSAPYAGALNITTPPYAGAIMNTPIAPCTSADLAEVTPYGAIAVEANGFEYRSASPSATNCVVEDHGRTFRDYRIDGAILLEARGALPPREIAKTVLYVHVPRGAAASRFPGLVRVQPNIIWEESGIDADSPTVSAWRWTMPVSNTGNSFEALIDGAWQSPTGARVRQRSLDSVASGGTAPVGTAWAGVASASDSARGGERVGVALRWARERYPSAMSIVPNTSTSTGAFRVDFYAPDADPTDSIALDTVANENTICPKTVPNLSDPADRACRRATVTRMDPQNWASAPGFFRRTVDQAKRSAPLGPYPLDKTTVLAPGTTTVTAVYPGLSQYAFAYGRITATGVSAGADIFVYRPLVVSSPGTSGGTRTPTLPEAESQLEALNSWVQHPLYGFSAPANAVAAQMPYPIPALDTPTSDTASRLRAFFDWTFRKDPSHHFGLFRFGNFAYGFNATHGGSDAYRLYMNQGKHANLAPFAMALATADAHYLEVGQQNNELQAHSGIILAGTDGSESSDLNNRLPKKIGVMGTYSPFVPATTPNYVVDKTSDSAHLPYGFFMLADSWAWRSYQARLQALNSVGIRAHGTTGAGVSDLVLNCQRDTYRALGEFSVACENQPYAAGSSTGLCAKALQILSYMNASCTPTDSASGIAFVPGYVEGTYLALSLADAYRVLPVGRTAIERILNVQHAYLGLDEHYTGATLQTPGSLLELVTSPMLAADPDVTRYVKGYVAGLLRSIYLPSSTSDIWRGSPGIVPPTAGMIFREILTSLQKYGPGIGSNDSVNSRLFTASGYRPNCLPSDTTGMLPPLSADPMDPFVHRFYVNVSSSDVGHNVSLKVFANLDNAGVAVAFPLRAVVTSGRAGIGARAVVFDHWFLLHNTDDNAASTIPANLAMDLSFTPAIAGVHRVELTLARLLVHDSVNNTDAIDPPRPPTYATITALPVVYERNTDPSTTANNTKCTVGPIVVEHRNAYGTLWMHQDAPGGAPTTLTWPTVVASRGHTSFGDGHLEMLSPASQLAAVLTYDQACSSLMGHPRWCEPAFNAPVVPDGTSYTVSGTDGLVPIEFMASDVLNPTLTTGLNKYYTLNSTRWFDPTM